MRKVQKRRGKPASLLSGLIKPRPETKKRRVRTGAPKPAGAESLCECGELAVARVRVTVGVPGESLTRTSIPLCAGCLEVERETQALLASLGRGREA